MRQTPGAVRPSGFLMSRPTSNPPPPCVAVRSDLVGHWDSGANDGFRHIAGAEIFDLLAPNRPFKPACLGQLSGDDFINPSTRQWPNPAGHDGPLLGALIYSVPSMPWSWTSPVIPVHPVSGNEQTLPSEAGILFTCYMRIATDLPAHVYRASNIRAITYWRISDDQLRIAKR